MGAAAVVDRALSGETFAHDAHESVLGPGAALADFPPSSSEGGTRARAIEATLCCVGRFGVSKTTVDDIAREARLSRATLYRSFPGGRDELFAATLDSEVRRFFYELGERLSHASDLEDLLVIALTSGADQIARHDALGFLLSHEPEVILPHVTFDGLGGILAVTARFLCPYLQPLLGETQARRVAEWMTRLVLSHVACPPGAADTLSIPGLAPTRSAATPFAVHPEPIGEERARRLVHQFVMPGIHVLTAAERSDTSSNQGEIQQ